MNVRKLTMAVIFITASAVGVAFPAQDSAFPHGKHEGVFPTCYGCHVGIETNQEGTYYPTAEDCASCHDGTVEERISWTTPTREATNLAFSHYNHSASLAREGESARCTTCHRSGEDQGMLSVSRASGQNCVSCHENTSGEHLGTGASCNSCHVTLREADGFDVERIRSLPQPPTHAAGGFLNTHAPLTATEERTCAVCHTQDSCARCHINADRISIITDLGHDPRVAEAVLGRPSEYPVPDSHEDGSWRWGHAPVAETQAETCANCHAQESCIACHQGAQLSAISALPVAVPGGASGVIIEGDFDQTHPIGFDIAHGIEASVDEASCEGCHTTQSFCIDCHQGPNPPGFHDANYRERHSADAYGYEADCASCHNTEVFCRGCHVGSGIASTGKLTVAFHNNRPFWLLGHASAARLELETCVSCHAQSDCMRCHSGIGAWRINPHGTDFDAARVQERNRFTCLMCHRQEPEEDR